MMTQKNSSAYYGMTLLFGAIFLVAALFFNHSAHPLLISEGLNFPSLAFFSLAVFSVSIIALYSKNYLKDEEGSMRFWLLFLIFSIGIAVCSFARNLEMFYIGWELVGLASFFLIGFYENNPRSIENSFLALANYKSCDIFFILAIFLDGSSLKTEAGFCLILATLAKSAQFPFSSWLYKSLEGPTPSSAVFYGGLSLHLGPFLLIQFSPLWDHSPMLKLLLAAIGIVSAIYAFLVGSARSDLKTSFAFASIFQVGIIYIELALGLYTLAMVHLIGHNLLRTWNYLRSNSFFGDFLRQDYHKRKHFLDSLLKKLPRKLYFHAFNCFYMDQIFIALRTLLLLIYFGFLLHYVSSHIGHHESPWVFIFLLLSNALSIYCFVDEKIRLTFKSRVLMISQFFILCSVDLMDIAHFNLLYLIISILSLLGLFYSFTPALRVWKRKSIKSGEFFLGLKKTYFSHYVLFLVCALSLSAAPGTIQYFYQEKSAFELWKISHAFAIFSLIALSFNSYHFLKLGMHAFLGREQV